MSIKKGLNVLQDYEEDRGASEDSCAEFLTRFPSRPTIFLGLGGTGCKTVSNIKELFRKFYGSRARRATEGIASEIPAMFSFVGFDTAADAHPANLQKGREWHHLPVRSMATFYDGVAKEPFFRDWLIRDFPDSSLTAGAKGIRNLGKLCMMHNLDNFHKALDSAKQQVMQNADEMDDNPIVYIFCSLTGGTGSGMLLDTCFILRDLFDDVRVKLYGFIALLDGNLPNVDPIAKRDSQVNTLCALKELHAFQTGSAEGYKNGDRIRYPYNVDGKIAEPFDRCHIISPSQADGKVSLPTPDHVTSYMARLVFMMTTFTYPQATQGYREVMDNNDFGLTGSIHGKGARSCYIVPAMGQVHFPVNETADWLTLKAAIDYIGYQVSGNRPAGRDEAESFISLYSLNSQHLLDLMRVDPQSPKGEMLVGADYTTSLENWFVSNRDRYKFHEQVVGIGDHMAGGRFKDFMKALQPNLDENYGRVWGLIESKMNELLVTENYMAQGAIDFLEDLKIILEGDLRDLNNESQAGLDAIFKKKAENWNLKLKSKIQDIFTDSGAYDRLKDMWNLKESRKRLASYLIEMEKMALKKAQVELARKFLAGLVSSLEKRIQRMEGLLLDLHGARTILSEALYSVNRTLQMQADGTDSSVENIRSYSVITQQWRNAYFESSYSGHLRPKSIISHLLNSGSWHPVRLLDTKIPKKTIPLQKVLAQEILDVVSELTTGFRNSTAGDILEISQKIQAGAFSGAKPQDVIAKLYYSTLKPQMILDSMKGKLQSSYRTLVFCGGIDSKFQSLLRDTDEFRDAHAVHFADNMEEGRFNFFTVNLPVALPGCDVLWTTFDKNYQKWTEDINEFSKDKKTKEFEVAKYHCFPGSFYWPSPLKYQNVVEAEKELFAKVFAISNIFAVSAKDQKVLDNLQTTPKEKFYGMFQQGKTNFWITPFFQPVRDDETRASSSIAGKITKLGSNVVDAYSRFLENPDARNWAREWVNFFEENFNYYYMAGQVDALKRMVKDDITSRKRKTPLHKHIDMWDEIEAIIGEWDLE